MAILLFVPVACLAPKLYEWMRLVEDHDPDHATRAKFPLFTMPGFYVVGGILPLDLVVVLEPPAVLVAAAGRDGFGGMHADDAALCGQRGGSVRHHGDAGGHHLDEGAAARMVLHDVRRLVFCRLHVGHAGDGLCHHGFVATAGPLRGLVHQKTYYFIGSLLFAFTVFYAYVNFAQYFIIWNANMPEETFWYVLREKGTWWNIGMVIIFGHFFLPFLMLLRIDWKLKLSVMLPLVMWAWLMHFVDLSFNIIPVLHPDNYHLNWMDLVCVAFIGGLLAKVFITRLYSHPIVPQKDPRFAESQEIYVPSDQWVEAATARGINHKDGGGH